MHHLKGGFPIAPGHLETTGPLLVQDSSFEALHHEGRESSEGDSVDAVGVAIEVDLQNRLRVEDGGVGAAAAHGFVLGAVDNDPLPLIGACLQEKTVHRVGAGHGAAVPTTVGDVLAEELLPDVGVELLRLRVLAILKVHDREEIVVVHDLHEMGGSAGSHPALLGIQGDDLFV